MPNITSLRAIGRDWYTVHWAEVWARKRIAPYNMPGVQGLTGFDRAPFPHKIHRTHLTALGFNIPPAAEQGEHGEPPANALRSHQHEAVNYIRSRRGTLLADEQRVGKTPEIMYSHDPEAGALVVVGPLASRAVWHEWAARRFGPCAQTWSDLPCSICLRVANPIDRAVDYRTPSFVALSGRTLDEQQLADARRARVVFTHFAVVQTWRELFAQLPAIGALAVDEAHLAGIQNKHSLTIESIRFLNTVAARCIMATGTPLVNKPKGLWPILDIVTPGAFGGFWDFARRYCDARPGAYGWSANGVSNTDELTERLQEVMIRRTWAQIRPGLPPISRSVEVVTLGDAKKDAIEELAARIRSQGVAPQTAVGDLARMRKLYAKEKAQAARAAAVQTVNDGHTVILWTWHREVAQELYKALSDSTVRVYGPIDGDMEQGERERTIELCRLLGQPHVLIATMGALSTAVNLSFASHEIFVELDWNPHFISQAEMRPFDGTQSISATYLVADCDVEQKLMDALLSKLETIDALGLSAGVGSVESVLRETLGVEATTTLSALEAAVLAEAAA